MTTPSIRLHDSLSGGVRELEPREPGRVGIYVCGPTVYSRIHVGNARPYAVFALYKRFLEHEGYDVTLVENVTDINDKIYAAAREQGVASEALAREMTELYRADTDRLGLGRPDSEPLASETMAEIVGLIESLVETGHAYPSGGDVYFSVRSFEDYGKLSNRRLEDLAPQDQGEPEGEQARKRDPLDFALWKAHKPDEDTAWDSPWGRGRPGWHIECSAMAEEVLGLDFEVHGGGSDLVFPHHENEIAQTEAARGKQLARIWMHNGMVRFGEEKMAKSVGNVATLADALDRHGRDALIAFFLGGHYRQPLSFSEERMEEAAQALRRLTEFDRLLERADDLAGGEESPAVAALRAEFFAALRDDFNTPQALAALFKLVSEGNRRLGAGEPLPGAAATFAEMLGVVGLETLQDRAGEIDEEALRLLGEREDARRSRDFARADEVRDELEARGWVVRDTPEGPVLVPAE
ncbi:MAG: cysteine--tRNA ligase [Solirubrobacterales bacterium]